MSEPVPKRRREKYSKLICLGCRARRIRCLLPDPSVQPSAQPQPADKACQRCEQNGFDCIVDHTTLGRPAQKRKGVAVTTESSSAEAGSGPHSSRDDPTFVDETAEKDLENFLMAHPDGERPPVSEVRNMKPSKLELSTSLLSPFHLMTALLERDEQFASSIMPEEPSAKSILDIVDDRGAEVLDPLLAWHQLVYPDIPSLSVLRTDIAEMHAYMPNRATKLFLFNILCDLAMDVPSATLTPYRHLQPKINAMLYHSGQLFLYGLARSDDTVLALELAAQYRPLIFTASQLAASHALKAMPFLFLSIQTATDLGYHKSGARLLEALHNMNCTDEQFIQLMNHCLHWIRLCCAQSAITPKFPDHILHLQDMNQDAEKCIEALQTASMLNLIPVEILLGYNVVSSTARSLASTREGFQHWRDLTKLGDIILTQKAFNAAEEEALHGALAQLSDSIPADLSQAILQQAELERHQNQIFVGGSILFFAVMHGAHAASTTQSGIRLDQAIEVSENIIKQLTLHDEADPDRPSHRRFLETYGRDRADQLEKALSTFINMSDTLRLNGVPYINTSRATIATLLGICKDIVESNAARLKGWGGLHERIDIQMILFVETARRLEHMSRTAGTREALKKGCVLTAGAKMIRSLHRILQDFKKTLVERQRKNTSGSGIGSAATGGTSNQSTTPAMVTPESAQSAASSSWDNSMTDDLFVDWENWPQFDAMDFSDLFGEGFNWDQL